MNNTLTFKPEYNLYKITDKLYCVEMPNMYDLSMLFVRFQEYYESPNPNVRGKEFDLDEYMRWYAISNQRRYVEGSQNSFTYPLDFTGYNIPSTAITDIFWKRKYLGRITIYDELMDQILSRIIKDMGKNPFYLIGTGKMDSDVLRHEIAHGFYHLYKDYKESMNALIATDISKQDLKKFKKILRTYHYAEKVMLDEVQAYVSTDEPGQNLEFPQINPTNFKKIYAEYYDKISPKILT